MVRLKSGFFIAAAEQYCVVAHERVKYIGLKLMHFCLTTYWPRTQDSINCENSCLWALGKIFGWGEEPN